MRLALLPNGPAVIDERGIEINGCFYAPQTVDRSSWFVEGRQRKSTVNVSYDRRRVDEVYVHDETEPDGFFVARLTSRSEKYARMSVTEVEALRRLEAELKANAKQSKSQHRLEFHEHASTIVKNAKALTAEAKKGVSKTGRRINIKETRETERNFERDRVARPSASAATPSGPSGSPFESAPTNVVPLRPIAEPARVEPDAAPSAPGSETRPNQPLTLLEKARLFRATLL